MMEKEKLRKADFFSGGVVLAVGVFIISQGMQMPMKDSWGGVQNVWYVSPALFPLFVGAMLSLLGVLLMRTAVKSVGGEGLREVVSFITSSKFVTFLKDKDTIRFYGIVLNLLVFVFLMVPHVDFFLSAILFLLTFFFMYYCGDHSFLLRMLWILLGWGALLLLLFVFGAAVKLEGLVAHPMDWLTLVAILCLVLLATVRFGGDGEVRRKFRISLLIGFLAPFLVGIIFKFLLLVPLPHEGMVVQLLDAIWYAEIWS